MQATSSNELSPVLFFPIFIGMWLGISGFLSIMGGWHGLADRFRTHRTEEGESFMFASGALGSITIFPVNYSGCLFIKINSQGFRLSVLFPFRFLAPPLFIPWCEVESVSSKRLWFIRTAVIQIRGTSTKIMFPGRQGRAVIRAYDNFQGSPRSNQSLNPDPTASR
jgi:hypothetical protein